MITEADTCRKYVLPKLIQSKFYFSILDYTGSATRLFADPEFDGEPAFISEEHIDEVGLSKGYEVLDQTPADAEAEDEWPSATEISDDSEGQRRKFYFDEGQVEIAAHLVYELDPDGKQLRVVKYTDYAGQKVRTLYPSAADLRKRWADPVQRSEIIARLEERGISFDELRSANQPARGRPV